MLTGINYKIFTGSLFDKETSSLDMTLVGLRREDIETAKKEIKKCCRQESADNYVSGKDLSDIIRNLSQSQVCLYPISFHPH